MEFVIVNYLPCMRRMLAFSINKIRSFGGKIILYLATVIFMPH